MPRSKPAIDKVEKLKSNQTPLKEARASSEIENVITTQDKLYQALSAKGDQIDTSTKEVLRYREAMLFGYRTIQKKRS